MHRVVVGALTREGRVLLVHRRPDKHAYPDTWDLPGGHLESGETELEALTRELHEELGVRIETDSTSHLCRLTAGPADEPVVLSAWLVRDWRGTPANVAPEEHDDLGWFDSEELPPTAHVLVREALVCAMRDGPAVTTYAVPRPPRRDGGAARSPLPPGPRPRRSASLRDPAPR